jgi:hypothetical protein
MRMYGLAVPVALAGAVMLVLGSPAWAQTHTNSNTHTISAPDYASPGLAGQQGMPESDGRPGVLFFGYGQRAFKKGDYRHAVDMYKVAASWAYKPAEYNLGVMYFKGQGVPVSRPLGAAWMVLAAERGNPMYVKVRDEMVTLLTKAQFAQTDELWGQLRKTYGDKVALRRAKAQWAFAKSQKTGTRVGGVPGELRVGDRIPGGTPHTTMTGPSGATPSVHVVSWAGGLLDPSKTIPGAVAYQQFRESDDPYSPIFLNHHTGEATVGPLQSIKSGKHSSATPASATSSSHGA